MRRAAVLLCLLLAATSVHAEVTSYREAVKAIQSDDPGDRWLGAIWFWREGEPETAVPRLIKLVRGEQDTLVLEAAMEGLARHGDKRAAPVVAGLVAHKETAIRKKALQVAAKLDPAAGSSLALAVVSMAPDSDPNWVERAPALLLLAEIGKPEEFFLVAEAYRKAGGPKKWLARSCFAKVIAHMRPSDALQRLTAMMGDADARVSATAGKGLYDLGEPGRARLTALLSHEAARVRIAAIAGVHQGGLRSAATKLKQLARLDRDVGVRWAAVQALWKFEDPVADEMVLEATKALDPALRIAAYRLLSARVGALDGTDRAAWRRALAKWRKTRK